MNVLWAGAMGFVLSIPEIFRPAWMRFAFGGTVLAGVLSSVVFAIVLRFADEPQRFFARLAAVALLVALGADVALLADPSLVKGTTLQGVLVLAVLEAVAVVGIVWGLLGGWHRLGPARPRG